MPAPRYTVNVVIDYLEACLEKCIYQVRIIHGKGTSVLRRTVHSVLEKHGAVLSFRLADEEFGSWGATHVELENDRNQHHKNC